MSLDPTAIEPRRNMLPLPPPCLGGVEPDPVAHRQMFGLEGPVHKGLVVSQPGPGDSDKDAELSQQDSETAGV